MVEASKFQTIGFITKSFDTQNTTLVLHIKSTQNIHTSYTNSLLTHAAN